MKLKKAPAFVGIDIGTMDVHGVLVTETGTILSEQHRSIAVHSTAPGFAEHDVEHDWWDNVCSIIRKLLHEGDVSPSDVAAIGVAGLFPVTCVLDCDGNPLNRAILYSDSRADQEVSEVAEICGQELIGDEVTPNLLWLARNRPTDFERTHNVLSTSGYVVYRLTGEYVIDPHNAYRFGGVVNVSRTGWRLETLSALGLPAEIFPSVELTTQIAGEVHKEASEVTGLAAGTPVITGTTDTLATLVGNGVLDPGDAMIYYGTTGLLTLITHPILQALEQPSTLGPNVPYSLEVYLLGSGAVVSWALDLLTALDDSPPGLDTLYHRLDSAAADLEPGADGLFVLPYLTGRLYPEPDSAARGHIIGLSLQHGVAHIWRALLEAPGYVLATRLHEPLPHPIKRIVAAGGGARSETWRNIISNIVGFPQYYTPGGGGALGAGFLAAMGTKHVSRIETIREQWLGEVQMTEPDPEQTVRYQELLSEWLEFDASSRVN